MAHDDDSSNRTGPAAAPGTVEIEHGEGAVVVALAGEHDMATAEAVAGTFADAAVADAALVVVDLGACRFADSTIVRTLLLERERCERERRRLVLVVPASAGAAIGTLLDVTGLAAVFELYASRDAALVGGRSSA